MCAETSAVLRAVAADFFFNCWYLQIPSDNCIRTYQGASTIIHKFFNWKHSRISMLEVEAIPPELYPISPNRLVYGFIDEKIVACCEV
jgi:hypothetical protein